MTSQTSLDQDKNNVFVLGITQGYIQITAKVAEDIDIFAVLTADTLNTESWVLDTDGSWRLVRSLYPQILL